MGEDRGKRGVKTLPICPECGALAGDERCPDCGGVVEVRDALLTVILDRATKKDEAIFGEVDYTAGSWDPKTRTAKIRTPEEWGSLSRSGARILRRKGTEIIGSTGIRFEYGDPVLECMATRKTSTLRTCMCQGLGESYCNALPGLLPLSDAPNHLSLADGLRERGLDAAPLVAAVIVRLAADPDSPVRCPLFGTSLDDVPVGDELTEIVDRADGSAADHFIVAVPREDADGWSVVPMPAPSSDQALASAGAAEEEPLEWGVALDDVVFGARDGVPVSLTTGEAGKGWPLPPVRHPGDLCAVVPSRWFLFWRRFQRSRRGDGHASWFFPGPDSSTVRTMPASIHALASFGSVPIGPKAMLVVSSRRLVIHWIDGDEPPAVIAGDDVTGERWRMVPLGERFLAIWSDAGDLLLYGNQMVWRLSPSRAGERWPVNPWHTPLFDGARALLPVTGVGVAVLSSDGHRLSILTVDEVAAAEAAMALDLTPPVEVRDDLVLPWRATSMGVGREGRIYLAGDHGMILLDPRARERAVSPLPAGTRAAALDNGGWVLEDEEGARRLLAGAAPPVEDFGADLVPFLKKLEAAAREAEGMKPRRSSMVENLYSLVRRRSRRARRKG